MKKVEFSKLVRTCIFVCPKTYGITRSLDRFWVTAGDSGFGKIIGTWNPKEYKSFGKVGAAMIASDLSCDKNGTFPYDVMSK